MQEPLKDFEYFSLPLGEEVRPFYALSVGVAKTEVLEMEQAASIIGELVVGKVAQIVDFLTGYGELFVNLN